MTEISQPLPSLLRMGVAAVSRHVASGLAGALVTAGAVTSDHQAAAAEIIAGVLVWAAGVAWSLAQKKALAAPST